MGKMKVVRFSNPDALIKEGNTQFRAPKEAGKMIDEASFVNQGMLEESNINPIQGMNELITITRSFEAFERVIQTFRDIDTRVAREGGTRQ